MRLIDADKLMESLDPNESVWVGLVLSELIDNAPTVKAIPIEWIKKYLEPFYEHYNALSPESQEVCGAGWVIDALETMMRDWEKENERP